MEPKEKSAKTFTVLVAVDYSESSPLVLVEAVAAARSRERSHLHVVHVVQPLQTVGPAIGVPYVAEVGDTAVSEKSETLRRYTEGILEKAELDLHDEAAHRVEGLTTHIRVSSPAAAIAQLASDLEADLVVVGTHSRRGFARLLLGSVAEGVVRLAPCPVLVVRPLGTNAADVPHIEPPCPRCVETRRETRGEEFWCSQHREHHGRHHTYHLDHLQSGHQSGLLISAFR